MRRHAALLLGLAWTLSASAAGAGARVELEPYHAHYALTNGYSDWTDTGVRLDLSYPSRLAWSARVRETERFGLRDTEAGGGLYAPLGGGWAASLDATASDTHRVLPRDSLTALLGKRLGDGWIVRAGLRRSQYRLQDQLQYADLRLVTIVRYFGSERVAYTFYSGKPQGAGSAPAHRLAWTHYFGERAAIGVSLARGREVENVEPQGLLVSRVRDITLSGQYRLGRRWGVALDAESHEQGDLYRRHGVRVALRYRF